MGQLALIRPANQDLVQLFLFHVFMGTAAVGKNLTAVAAKPIEATMTNAASSARYELALLAAAGTFTIIPGAIMIYFLLNYIAQGFEMERV